MCRGMSGMFGGLGVRGAVAGILNFACSPNARFRLTDWRTEYCDSSNSGSETTSATMLHFASFPRSPDYVDGTLGVASSFQMIFRL